VSGVGAALRESGALPGGTIKDALLLRGLASVLRAEELRERVNCRILEKGDERNVSVKMLFQAMMNLHGHHGVAAEIKKVVA
jgi:hypothetical protein